MKDLEFGGRREDVLFMLLFLKLWFGNRPISDIGVDEIRNVFGMIYRHKVIRLS